MLQGKILFLLKCSSHRASYTPLGQARLQPPLVPCRGLSGADLARFWPKSRLISCRGCNPSLLQPSLSSAIRSLVVRGEAEPLSPSQSQAGPRGSMVFGAHVHVPAAPETGFVFLAFNSKHEGCKLILSYHYYYLMKAESLVLQQASRPWDFTENPQESKSLGQIMLRASPQHPHPSPFCDVLLIVMDALVVLTRGAQ